jgi:peptidoglycan hydrolase-like protein with peptidoglycan-binding domain
MKKEKNMKRLLAIPAGLCIVGTMVSASMLDQLIYNVAGQATNAAGARIGDEIYYGSSRSAPPRARHRSHRKVHKTHKAPARYQMTDEMRIQRALRSLGYYRGPIDGEVNSFETRSAIKKLNQYYGISNSASLKPEVKDSLIYLGTLFQFDRYLIARGNDSRTKGRKIQTALKIHGFYHSRIDGAVGSGTRRAIAEYKTAQGLSAGSRLDFEEEYQLISTAKEMNDKNIEDTLASLQALGQPAPATVAPTVQRTAPQRYQTVQPAQPHYQQPAVPARQNVAMQPQPVPQPSAPQQINQSDESINLKMYTDKK